MHSESHKALTAQVRPWLMFGAVASSLALPAAQADESQSANQIEDEMVVVGSRLPTEPYKIGRSISVLDEQQIDDLGYEYGADLFRFVPGMAVSRTGGYGGLTQIRIRGAEGNHTLVLIDGVDVSKTSGGEYDMSALLSADIERIEVLRGPQSGLYGSNPIGGVINIVTRQPEAGFGLDVELEAGENDTRHGSLSISGGTDTLRGRLTYAQRRSEFNISETGSEDDEDDNRTLSGRVLFDPSDNLSFEVFGRYTEKDTETDGAPQGVAVDTSSFSNTEDLSMGAKGTIRLADGRSVTGVSVARSEFELDTGPSFGNEGERDDVRFDTSWQWQEGDGLQQRSTLFMQWESEEFRNKTPSFPSQVPTQDRDLFGFGLEHQIALNDALFINANVRRDNNDDFDDNTTYAVDVSYRLLESGTRLHASYGKAVTNPDFFQQFGFVPEFFAGNPDLIPEESKGWDVGVEQAFLDGSLVLDITYFDAELTDEIQGSFLPALGLGTVVNGNGDSTREGLEISANWMPTAATTFNATYTYTDAEEPSGEEVRRPEHMASLSVVHAFVDGRLRIAGGLIYNGEQLDRDFRNSSPANGFAFEIIELDSYTLANVNITYDITEELEVFARVENLFDDDYQEVFGYATPGRAAYAGVRYRFRN